MNVIAFSLYGNDPKYVNGMIENAKVSNSIYAGWHVWVWADNRVPKVAVDCLRRMKHVKVIKAPEQIVNGMFWRFLVADDPKAKRFIVRDADSRLCEREAQCVHEWIESGQPFHVIRDHPHHTPPMFGGMWGAVHGAVTGMGRMIQQWNPNTDYANDVGFLTQHIWPIAKEKGLVQHDSCCRHLYSDARMMPDSVIGNWRFVGEAFDATGKPDLYKWQMRLPHMQP